MAIKLVKNHRKSLDSFNDDDETPVTEEDQGAQEKQPQLQPRSAYGHRSEN